MYPDALTSSVRKTTKSNNNNNNKVWGKRRLEKSWFGTRESYSLGAVKPKRVLKIIQTNDNM